MNPRDGLRGWEIHRRARRLVCLRRGRGAAMLGTGIAIGIAIGLVAGIGAAFAFIQTSSRNLLARARAEADQIKENASREAQNRAKEIELTAKQQLLKQKENFEREHEAARNEMRVHEQRLTKREDTLDRKLDTLSVKEKHLDDLEEKVSKREKQVTMKEQQLDQVLREQRERLIQIAGISPEQAKEMLLRRVEEECRADAGAVVARITEQTQEEAKEKSRQIIIQAIQRYAAEQTSDHTVSTVTIPSDDMKGRVIGREGRNIRSFEKATGVDVIIDDTPGVVVVSCFDPVRREVARISLERLVQEIGRASCRERV